MITVNRRITLASRPVGLPKVSDFQLVYSALPPLAAGEVLVRSIYLSLDPCLRRRMSGSAAGALAVAIGETLPGRAVALVLESEDPRFRAGDAVQGRLGWQEYAVAPSSVLRKILPGPAPISTALGVLGLPGLTALFGLLDVCHPQRGETVVVSAAAGAVGMIAGQIAKIEECRVVGVSGSDGEISWLHEELGFDAAFHYQDAADLEAELDELCPDGVDVYFDNVGGATTDAVLRRINAKARISVCDQTSQYDLTEREVGPRWLDRLMTLQAQMQGFLVSAYAERFPEGLKRLAQWHAQGRLKYREEVAQGIASAPQAFIGMLQGKSQGKQLVQLSGA
jgi:NADPH-dependent curcumin reductase CurA